LPNKAPAAQIFNLNDGLSAGGYGFRIMYARHLLTIRRNTDKQAQNGIKLTAEQQRQCIFGIQSRSDKLFH